METKVVTSIRPAKYKPSGKETKKTYTVSLTPTQYDLITKSTGKTLTVVLQEMAEKIM